MHGIDIVDLGLVLNKDLRRLNTDGMAFVSYEYHSKLRSQVAACSEHRRSKTCEYRTLSSLQGHRCRKNRNLTPVHAIDPVSARVKVWASRGRLFPALAGSA